MFFTLPHVVGREEDGRKHTPLPSQNSRTAVKGGERRRKAAIAMRFVSERPAEKTTQSAPWKRSERQRNGPRALTRLKCDCCSITDSPGSPLVGWPGGTPTTSWP